jgi:hypothetical protein
MQSQPKTRARRSAQYLPKHKRNPSVPIELAVFLCLPECVGSLLDYEWFEPVRFESPAAAVKTLAQRLLAVPGLPVVKERPALDPQEVNRLLADPAALREFLAEKQRQIEAFEPWRKKPAFAELSGALSGGAL